MLDDLFSKKPLKRENMICHSGGAKGADSVFEELSGQYSIKTHAYSWKTKYHDSPNKVEITESEFKEGVTEINRANKILNRFGISKYMALLARNWAQVKYSKQVFAVGTIIKPGKKDSKGYYNKSKMEIVSGGTGYAIQMAINNEREVYIFEQNIGKWFRWSYNSLRFVELPSCPKISEENFAGIGTREINPSGVRAIRELFRNSFGEI